MYRPPVPRFLGTRSLAPLPLKDLVPFIDWMPFFNAWEFSGKFPDILKDPERGAAASALWKDARAMLDTLVRERWLVARAAGRSCSASATMFKEARTPARCGPAEGSIITA